MVMKGLVFARNFGSDGKTEMSKGVFLRFRMLMVSP